MKNYLIGSSLLLSSLVALPVLAEDDYYFTIGAGVAYTSDVEYDYTTSGTTYDITEETDNPAVFSVGIGKSFENDYRVELNYSKATVSTDSFTVSSGGSGVAGSITPALEYDVSSYMLYGYKDFPGDSKFTPYAGLGAGIAIFDADDQIATIAGTAYSFTFDSETVLSYALKGGVAYEASDRATVFTEATYQNFTEYTTASVSYDSNSTFAISAGLRFSF